MASRKLRIRARCHAFGAHPPQFLCCAGSPGSEPRRQNEIPDAMNSRFAKVPPRLAMSAMSLAEEHALQFRVYSTPIGSRVRPGYEYIEENRAGYFQSSPSNQE